MTCRNLTMTLEEGRMSTWRRPDFSALFMALSASLRTEVRTILAVLRNRDSQIDEGMEMRYLRAKKRLRVFPLMILHYLLPAVGMGKIRNQKKSATSSLRAQRVPPLQRKKNFFNQGFFSPGRDERSVSSCDLRPASFRWNWQRSKMIAPLRLAERL